MELREKTPLKTAEVYEILRGEILDLTLAPGSTIGENEMTKRFALSRTPIREVFKRLEIEGLVNVIPHKGTVITPIPFHEISEFTYIREKLEIGMVEDLLPTIQEESLVRLNLALLQQQKIIENKELPLSQRALLFYGADNEFHKLIFTMGNKESLWRVWTNRMPNYIRFRAVSAEYNSVEHIQDLYQHHCQIVNALESKDLISLKTIYKEHIYYGIKTFRQLIDQNESYFLV